jgi:hypothetical protein
MTASASSRQNNLATRLNVSADTILSDTTGASAEVLKESVLLSSRLPSPPKWWTARRPAALAADPNATGPAIT